ncbi:hypothetical protein GCM10007425_05850 [Lysinibacillus alkalisoli]|uniref:Uncharacterized protein n=1 Tax=Lysinibacillus alkalisoli TaxID=1911548 RepID=A0A917FYR7_9BACI|nr:hypothetical protein [Lysinibacillus alkalisoli]GGG14405.1 hypothetical protein GCM10007425_05850 [Lysinibacillus alkalisoli]
MIKSLISMTLLLLLSGCSQLRTLDADYLPIGKVSWYDEDYVMIRGDYQWVAEDKEVTYFTGPSVDALVKDFEQMYALAGDELQLHFPEPPLDIIIQQENEDGTIHNIQIKNQAFTLPTEKGSYIYEIEAKWDKGEVIYVFNVDVQ